MPSRAAADLWALDLTRDDCEEATVVVARGRVGVVSAPQLLAACASALTARRQPLVLDLCGVDYVSSAGLAVLTKVAGLAAGSGQILIVCGVTEPVGLIFDLAGVALTCEVAPTREWALTRLNGRARPETGDTPP